MDLVQYYCYHLQIRLQTKIPNIFEEVVAKACIWIMKLGQCNLVYSEQYIIIGMQIIHRFQGFYPFGLQHQTENTFVQLLKQNLSQEQISHYRLKYKFFKETTLTNLIKLVKLSRENGNLRFLYEYEPLSLQRYLEELSNNSKKKIEGAAYRCLIHHFKANIQTISKQLIHYQIKTDLLMSNLAVANTNTFPFQLKLFVEPECECFALQIMGEAKHEELKHLMHQNKLSLVQFYSNEKKKMSIQFEELMQLYFGKMQEEENRPNFIINGAKLVFINQEPNDKQCKNDNRERKKSTSSDKINFNLKNHHEREKRRGSGQDGIIKQITQLSRKKVNQIKGEIAKKNQSASTNHAEDYEHSTKGKGNYDNIHFQPTQITKDRTLIVQEQDYMQCLEDEIKNMNNDHSRNQPKNQQKQIRRTSPMQNKTQVLPNLAQLKSENGNSKETKDAKPEKKHKYKMKIITSHDVQIQEEKDPQTVDINSQNFNPDSKKKLFLENQPKNKQHQFSYENEGQSPQCRIIQARYSDGDSQMLNKEALNGRTITTSLINHDQTQCQETSNKCCGCRTQKPEPETDDKQTHIQNYLHKIQSAKEKAQKLLKQYAQHKVRKA